MRLIFSLIIFIGVVGCKSAQKINQIESKAIHKGMVCAAKSLAMTMLDFFKDKSLIEVMKLEFNERNGEKAYEAILPEGSAPISDFLMNNN